MSNRFSLRAVLVILLTVGAVALVGVSALARAQQTQTPAKPQAQPQAPTQAQAPFPADAKIAYMSIQGVIDGSKLGQSFSQKVKALQEQKVKEIEKLQKALQDNQAKLGSGLMNPEARVTLEREIERQQVDLQRAQQDAQAEVEYLQAELQQQFEQQVRPIIEKVAAERNLHMLFAAGPEMLWANRALDLTAEVARRLDAGK
ncbi:MAG: OmpH family outer membrane protein [Acidobacteria bacterium]|nr:MAG: OmpH family outer membrane protein [Acidobacteriota bacterium]